LLANPFDAFARAYVTDNERNAWNAYYERPAILALAGKVDGLHVLDAGCGGGAHASALVERGAILTGLDASVSLLTIAQHRLNGRAQFIRADLGQPLPFQSGAFDLVLSSLVLHYLRDWTRPLAEFHRILSADGRLIFSTHHPFMDHNLAGGGNYFETYSFDETWERGDQSILMSFWHRPLHAMFDALNQSGFQVETLSEPQPDPKSRELFPSAYESLTTTPRFLFFSCIKL